MAVYGSRIGDGGARPESHRAGLIWTGDLCAPCVVNASGRLRTSFGDLRITDVEARPAPPPQAAEAVAWHRSVRRSAALVLVAVLVAVQSWGLSSERLCL